MQLITSFYLQQKASWPTSGSHIMAQHDAESIVVYQSYRPAIGRFAAKHGYFGGEFSLNRMSWIKPNFLWMMYRNGWGTKEGQEVTLAVRLKRSAFDSILSQAVHSTYKADIYGSEESWQQAVTSSDVRMQWDPDHDPQGHKQERRAIQLGLRGAVLHNYARNWIVSIEDISDFVTEQRAFATPAKYDQLVTPQESVYPVENTKLARHLEL